MKFDYKMEARNVIDLFLTYLDMKMQILALNMYNLGTCVDFLHVSIIISID